MESEDPLVNVKYFNNTLFATTKDTIYSCYLKDPGYEYSFEYPCGEYLLEENYKHLLNFEMTIQKKCYNKIIRICDAGPIMVLVDNNRCEILYFDLSLKAELNDVDDIQDSVIKKGNDYYAIHDLYTSLDDNWSWHNKKPNLNNSDIFKFNKYNNYIAQKLDVNDCRSFPECAVSLMLVDNNIYYLGYGETTDTFYKGFVYTSNYRIINMFRTRLGSYLVMSDTIY
jgi:hypothetical protein